MVHRHAVQAQSGGDATGDQGVVLYQYDVQEALQR